MTLYFIDHASKHSDDTFVFVEINGKMYEASFGIYTYLYDV